MCLSHYHWFIEYRKWGRVLHTYSHQLAVPGSVLLRLNSILTSCRFQSISITTSGLSIMSYMINYCDANISKMKIDLNFKNSNSVLSFLLSSFCYILRQGLFLNCDKLSHIWWSPLHFSSPLLICLRHSSLAFHKCILYMGFYMNSITTVAPNPSRWYKIHPRQVVWSISAAGVTQRGRTNVLLFLINDNSFWGLKCMIWLTD